MSRMPLSRLARIGAWTGAALAWGTTGLVVRAVAVQSQDAAAEPDNSSTSTTSVEPALPTVPEGGLVVLRFTPATTPPQEVIVETKYVQTKPKSAPAKSSTSSNSTSSSKSSGSTSNQPTPPPPPASSPTTTAPAPATSGS